MNPSVPFVPESAPFSPAQRAWLNGFLAGLFSRTAAAEPTATPVPPGPAPALRPLTILFGSQTGTAEALARKAAREASRRQFAPTILDMAGVDLAQLGSSPLLLVITSTYGDGEPPDNARQLHAKLRAALPSDDAKIPAPLGAVRYAVCALGDRNYARFCECGKDFDSHLEQLGAQRVVARADCDVDYDATFTAWLDAALVALAQTTAAPPSRDQAPATLLPGPARAEHPVAAEPTPAHNRTHPFPAPVRAVRRLTASTSAKEVNHVELSLADSGLAYEAGDALGVFPHNCPELVAEILAALGWDGEEAVRGPDGQSVTLRRALTAFHDLGRPTDELLALLTPAAMAGASAAISAPERPAHVIDALQFSAATRGRLDPAVLVSTLRKLQPRLYSISSSPHAHRGEVHLTVGAVRYDLQGRARKGVCSTFLAERALPAGHVGVFVHRNNAFRLPASPDTPVIMVGPGTGIAPFRAFLAERQAVGARGRNWLFFGDQHAATDFLYRDELLAFQSHGLLTRLDLAWSRDQPAKIYVQDRMREQARELFEWLEAGAHFYVCGDAARMARDVDVALREIVATAGGRPRDAADAYVEALRAARRYQRDVY